MVVGHVDLPLERIGEICRKYQVKELSIFGSALREDFREDSDVDMLVDFLPGHTNGLIEYAGCQMELSEVLGRKVDLVSKKGVKNALREEILGSAKVVYAE